MVTVFIFMVVASGFLLHSCMQKVESGLRVTPGIFFDSFFAGLILSSLFGILLLEFGRFSVGNLMAVLLGFSLLAALCSFRKVLAASFALKPARHQMVLVAVLLLAAVLRYPPSNWITGGQDEGVYVNVGNIMSRTGKVFIRDELLLEVGQDDQVREYYLLNTYDNMMQKVPGRIEGKYTPGFFVKDFDKGIIFPRFYHLHPLWFAVSKGLLGVKHATFSLFAFSLLSIVLLYRLTGLVLDSSGAALAAAAVLAANPLHAYMSRFPVSEVTAMTFMLGGFYYLIRSSAQGQGRAFSCLMAVLSFGSLFFTRITGFTYMPVFVLLLLLVRVNDDDAGRRKAINYALIGIFASYAYSLVHGYLYSFSYTYSFFRNRIGIDVTSASTLGMALVLGGLIVAALHLAWKHRAWIRQFEMTLERRKDYIVLGIIGLIFLFLAYRGYVFAFTDAIPDRRWQIAGTGFRAFRAYNVVVLGWMMTPVAFVLSLYGMYRLLTNWSSGYRNLLVGALALYFFVIYNVVKYKTPYIYYYARYLLSEVVPLLTVCLAAGLLYIMRRNRRVFAVVLILILIPSSILSLDARKLETNATYDTLEKIGSLFNGDPIVFMDKGIDPSYKHLVAPLKFVFEENVVLFEKEDFMSGKLDHMFHFFLNKGHSLYLLSNDGGLENGYFYAIANMPITTGFHYGHVGLEVVVYGQTAGAAELARGGPLGAFTNGK